MEIDAAVSCREKNILVSEEESLSNLRQRGVSRRCCCREPLCFWSHVRFTSSMQSCKALCKDVMGDYGNSGWKRCRREELVSFSAQTRIFSFRRKMEHFRNKSVRSAHQGHSGKTFRQEQKLQTPSSTFLCHLFFLLPFLIIGSSSNPPEEIKQGTMVLIYFLRTPLMTLSQDCPSS